MSNIPKIYYITHDNIKDEQLLHEKIYLNLANNYYWSDDWSCEFYIDLAKAGFISVSFDNDDQLVLLPEMQMHYALLDFKNLHVSKKVKKLIYANRYTLEINNDVASIINSIEDQHKDNWLKDKYVYLMEQLRLKKHENFQLIAVHLRSNAHGCLVAGEIGYKIGKTYTSLSGFCLKDKQHNNCGNLQLVLLAQYLEKEGCSFWNLGHPYMDYKLQLGAKVYTRKEFLSRWFEARNR
ncbi:MAG: hypothetical protein U9N30_02700 [Campylobacterota bacterium]|nr:hypothetical protein [Campylobacterota bacterium]